MPDFDSGVKRYIKGVAMVTVNFPVSWDEKADVSCKQCQFFRVSSRSCALTGDVTPYPEKFVAPTCPLERIDDEEELTDCQKVQSLDR